VADPHQIYQPTSHTSQAVTRRYIRSAPLNPRQKDGSGILVICQPLSFFNIMYNKVISIGENCGPRWHARNMGIADGPQMVFDFATTSIDALERCLLTDFKDFGSKVTIVCPTTKLQFVHILTDEEQRTILDRVNRRIQRFRDARQLGRVAFVRSHTRADWDESVHLRIRGMLYKFGFTDFHVYYLAKGQEDKLVVGNNYTTMFASGLEPDNLANTKYWNALLSGIKLHGL
jgi:hypothetical protein